MTIAISPIAKTVFGNQRVVIGTIAFDSSYPTGGEATTVAELVDGYLRFPEHCAVLLWPLAGYTFTWRSDTDKIQVFSSGGTEVSNATDLSALHNVMYMVIGQ